VTPTNPADVEKYPIGDEMFDRIENTFVYHAPKADQLPRYEAIRNKARGFALQLVNMCPPSRELSLALTHLEEAVMQANAAIARHET
jgi:hypothetical protein